MQKYGLNAPQFDTWKCVICNENCGFNWSDLHGEGMCNKCGVAYYLKESTPLPQFSDDWIPALQAYWEETHKYMGLGTIMILRDYPECVEGRELLDQWLDAHQELIPKEKSAAFVEEGE